jgi:hypothetical protein
MDARLTKVDGHRLVHLLRSDAPRVAQALVDKMIGRAQVHAGVVGRIGYVEFVYPGVYSVVIRADDWRKIFPLIRYGSGEFSPIPALVTPPALVPSPQGDRPMNPAPLNPGAGYTSFLAFFTWEETQRIQRLLTMSNVGRDAPSRSRNAFETAPAPVPLVPPERRTDQSAMPDVYDRLVGMLQQLFPLDYPTHKV